MIHTCWSAFRLPADHPYYAQGKRMEIDPALVERMVVTLQECDDARRAYFDSKEDNSALFYAKRWGLLAEKTDAERFQSAHKGWHRLDRAELIERVLEWKETEA